MHGKPTGVERGDFENTIKEYVVHGHDSFRTKMTIDILFMAKNKLVLRVNMCCSNLESKILGELPIEDQWVPDFNADDRTFTDKDLIEKVWNGCIRHGCISQDYEIIGKFLDEMKIEL